LSHAAQVSQSSIYKQESNLLSNADSKFPQH
jgi:hypothetical protein